MTPGIPPSLFPLVAILFLVLGLGFTTLFLKCGHRVRARHMGAPSLAHARARSPACRARHACVAARSYEMTSAKAKRNVLTELLLAIPASMTLAVSALYLFLSVGLYV